MSQNVFSKCVCVLFFLVLTIKTDSQECGQSTDESNTDPSVKIIEKGFATEGMWPWMVATRMEVSPGEFLPLCSGFLIDKRHVLSAAHCYEKKIGYGNFFDDIWKMSYYKNIKHVLSSPLEDTELFRARIGNINQDIADEYRITRIAIPDFYSRNYLYSDIAVLTLDREVSFPNFSPICLPDEQVSGMNLTRRRAVVAGWAWGQEQNMHLMYGTDMQVMSDHDCEVAFSRIWQQNIFERNFPHGMSRDLSCAATTGQDLCMNSGGPVMIKKGDKWFAIGILTFGARCGSPAAPIGFTNVTHFLDWIRENTKD